MTVQPLLLECVGLNAWYGAAQTVFDVNLQIACGEVVALTGNNGAGKSSTLKALMGLMPRRTGRIVFAGKDISTCEPYQAARLGMGFVPEDRRIFTDLTVLENLKIGLQAPRALPNGQAAAHWDLAQIFELFPNLRDMQHRLGAQMSGGEQQMLTIARTLMGNPLLLLLDEPSEGVAPLIVEHMARAILNMKKRGIGVLLSEQNLAFANHVCDRQYKLIKGQLR